MAFPFKIKRITPANTPNGYGTEPKREMGGDWLCINSTSLPLTLAFRDQDDSLIGLVEGAISGSEFPFSDKDYGGAQQGAAKFAYVEISSPSGPVTPDIYIATGCKPKDVPREIASKSPRYAFPQNGPIGTTLNNGDVMELGPSLAADKILCSALVRADPANAGKIWISNQGYGVGGSYVGPGEVMLLENISGGATPGQGSPALVSDAAGQLVYVTLFARDRV